MIVGDWRSWRIHPMHPSNSAEWRTWNEGPVPNGTLHVHLRSWGLTMSVKSRRPQGIQFIILAFNSAPLQPLWTLNAHLSWACTNPSDWDGLQRHLMTWQPRYAAFVRCSLPFEKHSIEYPIHVNHIVLNGEKCNTQYCCSIEGNSAFWIKRANC